VSGGASVGHPVSARSVVGDTTAVPSGYIGESFEDSSSTFFTSGTPSNIVTRTLQPGKWRLDAYTSMNSGVSISNMHMSISTTSVTHATANQVNIYGGVATGYASGSTGIIVNISTATTYYVIGSASTTVTNSQTTRLISQRIA